MDITLRPLRARPWRPSGARRSRRSEPPTLLTPSSARSWTRRRCTGFFAFVFLRFLEDNRLFDRPLIAGPGERLEVAQLRQREWFRTRPEDSDAEYLLAVFAEVGAPPRPNWPV